MKSTLYSTSILKLSNAWVVALLFISLSACSSIRDNAVNLAYQLEAAAAKLQSQEIGSELVIDFEPVDTTAPFTILMLSENGVTYEELMEEGLDALIAEDLFDQLSYIDLKKGATLVVYQNGTISFTTYYRRFVDVKTTQLINGTGTTPILVKTIAVGPGNLSNEVLFIELD